MPMAPKEGWQAARTAMRLEASSEAAQAGAVKGATVALNAAEEGEALKAAEEGEAVLVVGALVTVHVVAAGAAMEATAAAADATRAAPVTVAEATAATTAVPMEPAATAVMRVVANWLLRESHSQKPRHKCSSDQT